MKFNYTKGSGDSTKVSNKTNTVVFAVTLNVKVKL